jgi:hypothetical protein
MHKEHDLHVHVELDYTGQKQSCFNERGTVLKIGMKAFIIAKVGQNLKLSNERSAKLPVCKLC